MDIFKSWLVEKLVAHRGLHDAQNPENSLASFENAITNHYAIELDVAFIADGTPVVFHDNELSRLTGQDGYISNLKKQDLSKYHLLGTDQTIPTLQQALDFIDGRTPVLIDIKNNSAKITGVKEQALLDILSKYHGQMAIMAFNPFVLEWFSEHAPAIQRGLLGSYFKKSEYGRPKSCIVRHILKHLSFAKRAQPNFIVYNSKYLPNRYVRKFDKLPLLAYGVTTQQEYLKVVGNCDNVIFENFEPKI